ncbi:MAG: FKBP-type peptidyl-prolyl cis-trans isomerase [Bacteroidetes bacterium]|nr:FKBP-type peptidyl-prolyl cis-trans isomerase [Bacteroidota bacterium]
MIKTAIVVLMIIIGYPTINQAQVNDNDTLTTDSGLKYVYIHHGTGEITKMHRLILVHYTGTFLDGKKFDSSRDRNTPFSFILGEKQVIKGWDEGISLLRIGDRVTFIVPYQLAYGEKGRGMIPPKSTLVFDVEVLDMKEKSLGMIVKDILYQDTVNFKIDKVIEVVRNLQSQNFNNVYVSESELNIIGYTLLTKVHRPDVAVEIMKLNVELYPDSANSYDSLAEAYMENGNKELAIFNYEKSLKLDPKNTNAEEMLVKLKQK